MPIIEGTTQRTKEAVGEYDFAVDGGATGTITLRAGTGLFGNTVPSGSVVMGGWIEVDTSALSATGTMQFELESAGDLSGALAQAALTAGRKSITPAFTGATTVKTTAARSIKVVIATAAFTAGKLRVVLFYK